ncbi:FecCD family ABC transporter permease [Cellulomonas bogoriensis]|uniref:Iron transporter n=1 Tax=Cellulomonas bogoriensis 69B4 = DSM 16987 TaxID=1386082 RepID=A0A0A0BLJ7_9CELL|nr:iron ABC transporter permease [Cellulomonas bogoriensis]KGM08826.1 iron transporter [Cellulomonas bogoriensis 69B4 = DSM 16987]
MATASTGAVPGPSLAPRATPRAPSRAGRRPRGKALVVLGAAVALVIAALVSITIGAYPVPLGEVMSVIAGRLGLVEQTGSVHETVVWDIRLTRTLVAIAVGASLAISGAVYQGVFRNPLVEPYVLGVSSGAAFGAGLAVLTSFVLSMQVLAFTFGMVAVFATYTLSRVRGQTPTVTLILAGVVIGSLFSAMFSLFQYVGTEEQLRRLVFWIMGGLYRSTWSDVAVVLPLAVVGCGIIWAYGWKLNVLTLGEEEAAALGIRSELTKRVLIVVATAITAIAVSVSGIIAWVGLMIPHAARLMIGPDNRYVLPLSAALGGMFVILCDVIARTVTTGEVPIGIITSILGAPYLIYLLRTRLDYFSGRS